MIVGKLLLQVKEFITSYRKVSLAFIIAVDQQIYLKKYTAKGIHCGFCGTFFQSGCSEDAEVHLKPSQLSIIEFFTEILNGF